MKQNNENNILSKRQRTEHKNRLFQNVVDHEIS